MTGQRSVQTTTTAAKQRTNSATSRDPLAPAFDVSDKVRQLHALIGNQAVGPLLKRGVKKRHDEDSVRRVLDAHGLTAGRTEAPVSQPNDELEREANRVADLATRELSTPARGSTDAAIVAALGGIFGRDFGRVRPHTGVAAAHAARFLHAQAFTVDRDIFLGAGEDASSTRMRGRLLAHELTHVVQNNQAPARAGGATIHVSGRTSAPGAIARAVTPNYKKIEKNLTYRIDDWAITDNEALEVVVILSQLSDEDLQDTVKQMETDGLVERLLDNFPDEHRTTFPNTIKKIQGARSPNAVTREIAGLMSYNLFDWAITDAEAHRALETFKDLRSANPSKYKQVVRSIGPQYFQRFFENISEEDQAANKEFLEELRTVRATGLTREDARKRFEEYAALSEGDRRKQFERDHPTGDLSNMLRALAPADAAGPFKEQVRELLRWMEEAETRAASGMSDEEMATLQSEFMAAQDKKRAQKKIQKEQKAAGKTETEKPPTPTTEQIIEAHEENVAEGSIEKKSKDELEFEKKKKAEKEKWEARANAVIVALTAHIKSKYPELKVTKENFKANFEGVEARGKGVFAMGGTGPNGERLCQFGQEFVEAAEADLDYVVSTVVHEVFGHPEFGDQGQEYHLKLYDAAAAKMEGYEKPTGKKRGSEIDNFGYQGTEIYSWLREAPYYKEPTAEHRKKGISGGDPGATIDYRVDMIRKYWHPKLASALARGLYQRFRNDPRITPPSLKLYENAVRKVFGDEADAILK